jgi:hypothetical protein
MRNKAVERSPSPLSHSRDTVPCAFLEFRREDEPDWQPLEASVPTAYLAALERQLSERLNVRCRVRVKPSQHRY